MSTGLNLAVTTVFNARSIIKTGARVDAVIDENASGSKNRFHEFSKLADSKCRCHRLYVYDKNGLEFYWLSSAQAQITNRTIKAFPEALARRKLTR